MVWYGHRTTSIKAASLKWGPPHRSKQITTTSILIHHNILWSERVYRRWSHQLKTNRWCNSIWAENGHSLDGASAHMPTQKQTEMMMTTGVKSNICIGSFVTRLFQARKNIWNLYEIHAQHWSFIHLFIHSEETKRNVSMRLAIYSRQISPELEFKRGFLIIFQSLQFGGKFWILNKFSIKWIQFINFFRWFLFHHQLYHHHVAWQCEKCIACLHQRNADSCNASNDNCIARISCKLTIFNLLICM